MNGIDLDNLASMTEIAEEQRKFGHNYHNFSVDKQCQGVGSERSKYVMLQNLLEKRLDSGVDIDLDEYWDSRKKFM